MTGTGVGIVGAGGWGTALASLLGGRGIDVTLWARNPVHARALALERTNETYLPAVPLAPSIRVTTKLEDVAAYPRVILAVPSQAVREIWTRLGGLLSARHTVINAAKGLDVSTGLRMSEILSDVAGAVSPERLAVLSGPNHAEEVGRGLPTTSVVASWSSETAEEWQDFLISSVFRVYTSEDVTGVELGGALKNVIALAAGISDGLGFGDNTKAALITRGLAEMARLGVAMGAQVITFSGLSGMGDLIATCTSSHSRNTRAGRAIGKGASADEVAGGTPMVIEGIPTCRAALRLAKERHVEMPITAAVGEVLFNGKKPLEAVEDLMGRGPKDETAAIFSPNSASD